jgi:hypothetical protein
MSNDTSPAILSASIAPATTFPQVAIFKITDPGEDASVSRARAYSFAKLFPEGSRRVNLPRPVGSSAARNLSTLTVGLFLSAMPCGFAQTAAAAPPSLAAPSQLFQGPASGVGGDPAPMSIFSNVPAIEPGLAPGSPEVVHDHTTPRLKDPEDLPPPLAPAGSNEIEDNLDHGLTTQSQVALANPIVSFPGIAYTGRIPPDPIIAAGPSHLIAAVNWNFAVLTKSGASLARIAANTWFSNVVPNVTTLGGAFDPQVIYDHTAGRWILVYLASDKHTQSWILLSVSNNADPTGQWCNIPLRGDVNGSSPSGNWADYPGVGLDSQALYIATNQYQYTSSDEDLFAYSKIRVIPKSQIYGGGCVAPSYYDFWDLVDPMNMTTRVFTLRPATTFGIPGIEYLVNNSPFPTSTYVTLWSLTSPLSQNPSLAAQNIPVTTSFAPPNADQLGGSGGTLNCPAPCLIDTGGGRLLGAVYRDGSIWTTHGIAGGTGNAYSRARYIRISVGGSSRVLEDVSFGVDGCWYYYPAVAVDQNGNLGMVFTRSCTSEYASARYTGRATPDTTLQPSVLLKAGEANYLNPEMRTNGRNRWGDYSGAAVDPTDSTRIWLFGEYAASPTGTWGTWVDQVAIRRCFRCPRVVPFR